MKIDLLYLNCRPFSICSVSLSFHISDSGSLRTPDLQFFFLRSDYRSTFKRCIISIKSAIFSRMSKILMDSNGSNSLFWRRFLWRVVVFRFFDKLRLETHLSWDSTVNDVINVSDWLNSSVNEFLVENNCFAPKFKCFKNDKLRILPRKSHMIRKFVICR